MSGDKRTRVQSAEFGNRPIPGGKGISTGAELLAGYAMKRYLHVNVSGFYRIWTDDEYLDQYFVAGTSIDYTSTKITASGTTDTAVSDNSIIAKPAG